MLRLESLFETVRVYFSLRSPAQTVEPVENLSSAAVELLFMIILSITCHISLWSFVTYKSERTHTAEYLWYSNEQFFFNLKKTYPNKTWVLKSRSSVRIDFFFFFFSRSERWNIIFSMKASFNGKLASIRKFFLYVF